MWSFIVAYFYSYSLEYDHAVYVCNNHALIKFSQKCNNSNAVK